MRRSVLTITGIAVVLVLVVAALVAVLVTGGGEGGEQGSTQQPAATGTAQARGRGGPAGNELRLLGDDPVTLDPHLTTDAGSARYIVEVFGGLVTLDPDLNIVGDIAERWEVSDDGKTYTFFLRRNVVFHTGTPRRVTAQDFKWSIERAANPQTGSTTAWLYLGDIVGVKDKLSGRASEVSGVEVVDDSTLRITIDAPKPYFLAKLTYPVAFVLDRNQVEQNPRTWTRRPNGTGPFRLVEWRLGERLVLERNERYHLGPANVEKVTYLLAGGSPMVMYENGEIDVTGVSLLDADRVRDPRDPLNQQYVEQPQLSTFYVGFNVKEPPFDDVKVRQAFAMAIDKERIAEVVLRDLVVPAKGILPPGMPGYNENLQGLPYDPERAKQLLAESRYAGNLPPITMAVAGRGATVGPTTEAILAMWQENLGVTVEIQQAEFATFLQDVRQGRYQMFELGWIADYVDPEDFLDIKLHGQSPDNDTRYSNPEVDRLLEQARTEPDHERRLSLYQQAEQIIVNDAPWIPLFHDKAAVLVKPYVKDYFVEPLVIPKLRYVRIEQQ